MSGESLLKDPVPQDLGKNARFPRSSCNISSREKKTVASYAIKKQCRDVLFANIHIVNKQN